MRDGATPQYREHALHPALRGHVEAAWSVTNPDARTAHLVVPDGCIDLVELGGRIHVAGPTLAPSWSAMPAGARVRGLRFRPGAAPAVLRVGAHELRDRHVPLADLWPGEDDGFDGVQDRLVRRLRDGDPVVAHVSAALRRDPGAEIAGLARDAAISPRQLRRRFEEHVGYGPKRLARILRLQRLLALGRRHPALAAARLAADAGYADQAHMTREVRALAGVTPGDLLARRGRSVQAS